VDRDVRRQHIKRIVARAGVALEPAAAWLLMRLDERAEATPEALAHRAPYDTPTLHRAMDELRAASFVVERTENGAGRLAITDAGCTVLGRIVAARRAHLAEVFGEWSEGERQELSALLRRLTPELVPDARSGG
jgi:DNA-binding MarR family transcriptional regulator